MEKKRQCRERGFGKPEEKKSAEAYYEKRPEFGNRGRQRFCCISGRDYLFPCYCGLCDLLFSVTRIEDISVGVSKVIDVLKPILYGMVIAYLLNPIVKQIDRWLIPQLKKKMSQEKAKKVSRSVGVFLQRWLCFACFDPGTVQYADSGTL